MTSEGQTDAGATPRPRSAVLGTVLGLLVLLGIAAFRLDRSELTPAEGVHAQAALGPLENDWRGVPRDSAWSPAYAFWRGWAMVAGTTERMLRLSVMLGLILAAVVSGEAAARLFAPAARGFVYLLWALSPFLNRSDLLHPGLLAPLPAALLLGGFVFARGGSSWWLLGAALGAGGLSGLEPRSLGGSAVVILLQVIGARGALRRIALAVATAGPTIAGLAWPSFEVHLQHSLRSLQGVPPAFSLISGLGLLPAVLLVAAGFVVPEHRPKSVLRVAGLVLAGLLFSAVPGSIHEWSGWSAFFTAAVVIAAGHGTTLPPPARRPLTAALAAMGALSIWWPTSLLLGYEREPFSPRPWNAMRDALTVARAHSAPGGRFVVAGPLRMGILFYARRGHDPGVPLVLMPEDVKPDDLADLLRHQLRVTPGTEDRQPPILLLEDPSAQDSLPGLSAEVIRTPAPLGLLRVKLLARNAPR